MERERIEIAPEAVAEAAAAYQWYAERSVTAANRFMAELDHALAKIVDSPESWQPYEHGTRRYLLRRFPYQVVYRIVDDRVQVVAVAHLRRRPGYWRYR